MRNFLFILIALLLATPVVAAEKGFPFVLHDEDCTDLYDTSPLFGSVLTQTSGDPDSVCDYDKRVSTGTVTTTNIRFSCLERKDLGEFDYLKVVADAASGITSFWAVFLVFQDLHDTGNYLARVATMAAAGNTNSVRSEYLVGLSKYHTDISTPGGVLVPTGVKDFWDTDLPTAGRFCVELEAFTGTWDGSISLVPMR